MKYIINSEQKLPQVTLYCLFQTLNHISNNNDIPKSWKQVSLLLITKFDKPIEVQNITPINFVKVNDFFF